MDLAHTLKFLRKERGLTQEELAQATGISFHSINSYESGRREPNSKAMAALERFFHVSGEFLRGETDSQAFHENNDTVQTTLDSLAELFRTLKLDLSCANQQSQISFLAVLNRLLPVMTKRMLHADELVSSIPDDLVSILAGFLSLNHQGREELKKRVDELLLLPQYKG